MMYRTLLALLIFAIIESITVSAVNVTAGVQERDTVAAEVSDDDFKNLSEVVVEGRTQRVIEHGVEYIPSKRTKKAAIDAVSLLRLMAIPQLDITPNSGTVKMIDNRDVSIFIDYAPANSNDLSGMRTEDVLRVEVLQYPTDPRFQGAAYVINYIMQKYEWGGYTKLSGNITPFSSQNGGGSLYTKYTRNAWTFDASAGGRGSRNTNLNGNTIETFRDIFVDGNQVGLLERRSENTENLVENNSQWAMFRAVYGAKGKYISHTLSFSRSANPRNNSTNKVTFSEPYLPSAISTTMVNDLGLVPSIGGYYYFILPHNSTLTVDWNFTYSRNRRNSSYILGDLDPIINNNREDAYSPTVDLSYMKKFPRNNTLHLQFITMNSVFNTRYDGSYDGLQKLISSGNMFFVEYMKNWNFGLSLYSRIGVSCVYSRVNSEKERQQWDPRVGFQLNYMINNKNSVSLEAWLGNSHPQPSLSNSAIVQRNELMWLQGNPDLHNVIFHLVKAAYNFIPTNKVSLAMIAQYSGNPSMITGEYMVRPEYNGIVIRYSNNNHPHVFTFDAIGTLRLFDNSLMLQAGGTASRTVLTGVNASSLNNIAGKISATYFIGDFTISGYYITPVKSMDISMGQRFTQRSTYGLSASYAKGDFKVSLSSSNWGNSYRSYTDFNSTHYSSSGWTWNGGTASSLSLSLSYTFSYGKKISHNDEVQNSSSAQSAILK